MGDEQYAAGRGAVQVRILHNGLVIGKERSVTMTFQSKCPSESDRRWNADGVLKVYGLKRLGQWKDNAALFGRRSKALGGR